MKITKIETIYIKEKAIEKRTDSSQDALLIKISTDSGIIGWGEVDSCPVVAEAIINAPYSHKLVNGLKNLLIGENPLEIEGHTDNVPINTLRFPSNWELSVARASVIAAFLESKLIPIKRMQVAGYGDTRPRFFPDTAYKRNLNRRVQLLLLPEDKDR